MEEFRLKFLNADSNNTIQFLPYGVTTIEFSAENVDKFGYISPKDKDLGNKDKKYVGFVDGTKDFLVVWGAGKEKGQYVNSNLNERMFMQIIHIGGNSKNERITFTHSEKFGWNQQIFISKASNDDVVRMKKNIDENSRRITFEGSKVPTYYSRWFPPRPTMKQKITYQDVEYPEISIEYQEDSYGVNSPMSIFLHTGDQKKKIGSIRGDTKYSSPHVEIFSLLPDNGIFVLRMWLYWIHKRFDGNLFLTFKETDTADGDYRRIVQQETLEIPDIERFDFVIDIKKGKIIWYGTDFHYQEYWASVKEDNLDARIAGGLDLIFKTLDKIPLRFNPPNNYNPVGELIKIISENQKELELLTIAEENKNESQKGYRPINIRTHVPYVNNSEIPKTLVSSIVSGKID